MHWVYHQHWWKNTILFWSVKRYVLEWIRSERFFPKPQPSRHIYVLKAYTDRFFFDWKGPRKQGFFCKIWFKLVLMNFVGITAKANFNGGQNSKAHCFTVSLVLWGYAQKIWVGVCCPLPKNILFKAAWPGERSAEFSRRNIWCRRIAFEQGSNDCNVKVSWLPPYSKLGKKLRKNRLLYAG